METAHEEQHVKYNKESCQEYKACVNDKTVHHRFSGSEILFDDLEACGQKTNFGIVKGLCAEDEKLAYQAEINRGKELLKEKECEKEKTAIQARIEEHSKFIDNPPPNCN
jgi:hypothetical protein